MQANPETNPCTPAEEPMSSRDSSNDEASGFDVTFGKIQETQDDLERSLEVLKINHQRDHMVILEILEEDKLRYDRLKQELADFTELHEEEIWNLKKELISTKDKILYLYLKRNECREATKACNSHLLNLELQMERVSIPRRLLWKIIGVHLAVLTFILVFASMAFQ